MGGAVSEWLTCVPHSTTVILGARPSVWGLHVFLMRACVGFLRVIWFPILGLEYCCLERITSWYHIFMLTNYLVTLKVGYTLDQLPANQIAHPDKQPFTCMDNLKTPTYILCYFFFFFFKCGKKSECPEKAHASTQRTQLHLGWPESTIEPQPSELWGCRANYSSNLQQSQTKDPMSWLFG